MDENTALTYLSRRFTGEATPEEMAALERWMEAHPTFKITAAQYEKIWQNGTTAEPELTYDADAHFQQLLARNASPVVAPAPPKATLSVRWYWLAAAAMALLLTGIWWWNWSVQAPDKVSITTSGQARLLTLPDGSQVRVAPYSTLEYPAHFLASIRQVHLVSGSAIFKVEHHENHPFVVETPLGKAEDLGTKFWLQADSATLNIAVEEGLVRLQPHIGASADVAAHQKAVFSASEQRIIVSQEDDLNQFADERGFYFFRKTPLPEVLQLLQNKYQLDAISYDSSLKNCTFSGKVALEQSVFTTLKDICAVYGATYRQNGKQVLLVNGSCQ